MHEIVAPNKERLEQAGFTRSTSYELFMLSISLLSFINLILLALPLGHEPNQVVLALDLVTAFIFLADFLTRFFTAKSKREYFFHHYGWSDLLASIPVTAFNLLRIFRVMKFVRASRILGFRTLLYLLRIRIAETALYAVFFMIVLLLEFGSIAVLMAENGAATANILNASDAMWWVFVSITTVGYGDRFPVTDEGRLVGVLTLTVGVGLFGVVTGYLANLFLGNKAK